MDDDLRIALEKLPVKERTQIEKEARDAAYDSLSITEQEDVANNVDRLKRALSTEAIAKGNRPQPFGDESVMELLAALSEFLCPEEKEIVVK